MFRKIVSTTALALAVGVLAVGCSDDDDDGGSGLRLPDNFPGNLISANFLSQDGAAVSASDADVEADNLSYWLNSQSRAMIVIYARDGRLYCSYTAGNGQFTQPTPVRGDFTDGNTPFDPAVVWVNTAGNSDAVASSRNGDAIILFSQNENSNPTNGNTTTDSTDRLYSCYFDRSRATQASTFATDVTSAEVLEFRYGFQVRASVVDNDPDESDTGFGSADVSDYGFVSDSMNTSYGTYNFVDLDSNDNTEGGTSGDPTSFVYALWLQDPDGNGATNTRYLQKQFPLTTADSYSFPTGAPGTLAAPTGIAAGDSAGNWIAHNGAVLADWAESGGTDNNDPQVTYYQFTSTGVSSGVVISVTDDTTDVTDSGLNPNHFYGGDHGLNHLVYFWTEGGHDDGTRNVDTDLVMVTLDGAGALSGVQTEIDGFSTGNEAATVDQLDTRIARDGSWIAVGYRQKDDDDNADAVTLDNLGYKVVAYDTSRTLASGTSPVSTPLQLTANMGGTNEGDAYNGQFQVQLADGSGFPTMRQSFQSRLDTMNITYGQGSHDGTLADLHDELHAVGFRVVLDAATPAVPTVSVPTGFTDTIVATIDNQWGQDPTNNTVAYDNGAAGDGLINVAFSTQANGSGGDGNVAGTFSEVRLFHWEGGTTTVNTDVTTNQISSDGTFDALEWDSTYPITAVTVPRSTASGAHGGRYTYLFWSEEDDSADSQLWHNVWNQTLATGAALTGSAQISDDVDDSVEDTQTDKLSVGVSGSTVGVYYQQDGHLWYAQGSSGAAFGGPDLVDNHYFWIEIDAEDDTQIVFDYDGTSSSGDDLPSTLAAFSKELDDDSGNERLLFRVKN